jgi:ABC-type multidrug transport system ATPase subunit
MQIEFRKAGRRFPGQTVFKELNLNIASGSRWAILGGNGSGKSTFLKTAFGALSLSSGSVTHFDHKCKLELQEAALRIGYAAPYLELIEELRVLDFLNVANGFRPFKGDFRPKDVLSFALLEEAAHKKIRNLSSGMKQRLRLCLAIYSKVDLLILDEPTSNLDEAGSQWYRALIERELDDRTLLIGTNFNENEGFLCDQRLEITDYQ